MVPEAVFLYGYTRSELRLLTSQIIHHTSKILKHHLIRCFKQFIQLTIKSFHITANICARISTIKRNYNFI